MNKPLTEYTPQELAQLRLLLADNYSKLGEIKVGLLRKYALYYKENRNNGDHKSDASLDRAWDLTDDGLALMELKEKMKSIEHKLSAIRTLLEVKNNEVRNNY